MKLGRIRHGGAPHWCRVEDDHVQVIQDLPGPGDEPKVTGQCVARELVDWLPPASPANIFAVGRNYVEHAAEMGLEIGAEPSCFLKSVTSLLAPDGLVVLPPEDLSREVAYEAELAIVVGRSGRCIVPSDVWRHVLGYTCANDVTARDLQRRDTHVIRAKGFDTFCPLGPWVDTTVAGEDLRIECRVNGELRQKGHTSEQIFDVSAIVSWISQWATLRPGDVILTGSPAGRGRLSPGDEVAISIEGIGTLHHGVAGSPG